MADEVRAAGVLSGFRDEFYRCLSTRSDALFELADAVLCTDGPVKTLVDLTLAAEHRRGHGALYDALNQGRIDVGRLRRALTAQPLPRFSDDRIVLAVDVSPWLRSDAACSPDLLFCHVYGRAKSAAQFIPGWPYSFVVALEPGRTSWTAMLDVVRLGPADDATAVTATQLREVVDRLIGCGQQQPGDPGILIVCDAGYDVTRLAWVLRDLPVEVAGRIRADRVLRLPAPLYEHPPHGGRPPKHGGEFDLKEPDSWPEPAVTTINETASYGKAETRAWDAHGTLPTHRSLPPCRSRPPQRASIGARCAHPHRMALGYRRPDRRWSLRTRSTADEYAPRASAATPRDQYGGPTVRPEAISIARIEAAAVDGDGRGVRCLA